MLLTITTTYQPATDLGYLLHKHPEHPQTFALAAGPAYLFYPEASRKRCTAALLLEIDPLKLARRTASGVQGWHEQSSVPVSLLSVALCRVFSTAMHGRCQERPDLAARMLPLSVGLSALPCRGGVELIGRLFEPLGYTVGARALLREQCAGKEQEEADHHEITLRALCCLVDLLVHLYILLPVLDHEKHYRVTAGEVDKLLRHGRNWLALHPEREFIVSRYLPGRPDLVRLALARLQAGLPAVTPGAEK